MCVRVFACTWFAELLVEVVDATPDSWGWVTAYVPGVAQALVGDDCLEKAL